MYSIKIKHLFHWFVMHKRNWLIYINAAITFEPNSQYGIEL